MLSSIPDVGAWVMVPECLVEQTMGTRLVPCEVADRECYMGRLTKLVVHYNGPAPTTITGPDLKFITEHVEA